MLPSERKNQILAILKDRSEISVKVLAKELEVPATSVRRDLRELEVENRVTRRHGRAIYRPTLVAAPVVAPDTELDAELLDELVTETAFVCGEARNIFLAGGAVAARVAAKVRDKTIVTHDLTIAMAAASGGNDVSIVGREVDNLTMTLRSLTMESDLRDYSFDLVVLEVDGIDEQNLWVSRKNHGLLDALLARADSFLAIARSNAIGRKSDRVAAPVKRADLIVMDRGASAEARKSFGEHAELRVAGESEGHPFAYDQVGNVYVFKRTDDRFGGGEQ